jgi:hypothetical protein
MERLSFLETGKKIAADIQDIGRKLGRRCLDDSKVLGSRLLDGFKWSFERAEKICGKLEKRFGPVGRRWMAFLVDWWERRGLPLPILHLALNALLFLPLDIGWYLLACVEHVVGFNPHYLLAWLVFAGSVRAGRFYFKEILPGQRALRSVGKAGNGTQSQGGS